MTKSLAVGTTEFPSSALLFAQLGVGAVRVIIRWPARDVLCLPMSDLAACAESSCRNLLENRAVAAWRVEEQAIN